MNITQDGQLIKWTFTAEDQGPEVGRTQYPVLWVMRNAEIAFSLNGSQAVLTDYPNVYEYIPDSPLSVEAGDYIAVLQPPEDTAHLLLSVVQCPVPGSELNVEKAVVPLVSLEVVGQCLFSCASHIFLHHRIKTGEGRVLYKGKIPGYFP